MSVEEDRALALLIWNKLKSGNSIDVERCIVTRDEVDAALKAARRGVEAGAEIVQIRDALTGDDYASLPSDLPTVRMAHTIRADHDKFRNQVRDTCARAERAEADRDAAAARERDGICDFLERWAVLHDGADFEFDRLIDEIRARADQPELPSAADDEATRWRHGEPTDQRGPAAIGETGRAHGPTPDNHADAAGEQSGPHPTEGGKS